MAATAEQLDGLEYARYRLMGWGEWLRAGGSIRLGLPSEACHLAEHLDGMQGYSSNPGAEEVETLMGMMRKDRSEEVRDQFQALKQEYYHANPPVIAANYLGVSRRTYEHRRKNGENRIAGMLVIIESNNR